VEKGGKGEKEDREDKEYNRDKGRQKGQGGCKDIL
jgi:hypothetical protein